MPDYPCPYGRRQVAALASMNMRGVTTHSDVRYYARPPQPRRMNSTVDGVGPRFQPRNEVGQFVSYEHFHILVAVAYEVGVWQGQQQGLIGDEEITAVEEFTAVEAFPWGEGCPEWDPFWD